MSAADAARNRVSASPHPRVFAAYLLLVGLAGLAVLAAALRYGDPGRLSGMQGGQVLALGTATVLVMAGELRPIFGTGVTDPLGVAWSTTFVMPVLLHFGLLPALVLHAVAALVAGGIERHAVLRTLFNVGQYLLTVGASWLVLWGFNIHPRLDDPWTPTGLGHLAIIVLVATVGFGVNNALVSQAVALLQGVRWWDVLKVDLVFQSVVSAAQYGLAPLVVVLMQHAPTMILISVIPLTAIHRSAGASLESHRLATHDDLTGLGNRKKLVDEARTAIADAQRSGHSCALFVLDLDRFKEVNDVLGHPVGDEVLRQVSHRLRDALRPGDLVARLGGDEFAVLLPRVDDVTAAREVADRLRSSLETPLSHDGQVIDLDASIGIALVPDHATDYEPLFSRADIAMYHAKRARSGVEVYDAARDDGSATRLGMLTALRRALDHDEIELHYQPKAVVQDGGVAGVEALVRWRDPQRGLVPPDEFIPLAEQSGLMQRLTDVVMSMALEQTAQWARQGMTVPVAVNVSFRDLHDPGFAHRIEQRLARHGLPARLLTLEITERVLSVEMQRAEATLRDLHDLGVRLSLDDFGTGWSSVWLLRQLPLAEIKIDRSFVSRAAVVADDATVVRGVTALAHGLGLQVVAEGVETEVTWQTLRELGCDTAQGWFIARPMPAAETTVWLRSQLGPRPRLRSVTPA